MERENAAKQTLDQLHERRKQVVRLHKKGIKIMTIVAMTGLSYPCVRSVVDLFVAGRWPAFVQLAEAAPKAMVGCSARPKSRPSRV